MKSDSFFFFQFLLIGNQDPDNGDGNDEIKDDEDYQVNELSEMENSPLASDEGNTKQHITYINSCIKVLKSC